MVIGRMLLGAALGLMLLLAGMLIEGGSLRDILQLTAFLMVAGGTAGFLLVAYAPRTQARSIGLALGKSEASRSELLVAQAYFSVMGAAFVVFGLLTAVLGLIAVMKNLDHPEEIGPGIAVAFTGLLYGFLFRLFFASPLGDAIATRLVATPQPAAKASAPAAPAVPGDAAKEVAALKAKIADLVMQLDKNDRHAA